MGAVINTIRYQYILTERPKRIRKEVNSSNVECMEVEFKNVSKWFINQKKEPLQVLKDIDLGIQPNEFTCIVGPSGCGKSTLLNMLVGLSAPERGQVVCSGKNVIRINTEVGYVTQDSNLLPWLTVLQNVMLPLEIKGVKSSERLQRARNWIELVGLKGFEEYYPHQLSGGMQKRVSIARTMVYDPQIILMDEPFGPLDAITRQVLQNLLLDIWQNEHKTVIFVTHDLMEAIALGDRIVIMTKRPGQIKAVLPVELARPRNVFQISESQGFAEIHKRFWQLFQDEVASN